MAKGSPCLECADRHTACHSECEKYKEFRIDREMINEAKRIENEKHEIAVMSALNRAKARKRGKRKKL